MILSKKNLNKTVYNNVYSALKRAIYQPFCIINQSNEILNTLIYSKPCSRLLF